MLKTCHHRKRAKFGPQWVTVATALALMVAGCGKKPGSVVEQSSGADSAHQAQSALPPPVGQESLAPAAAAPVAAEIANKVPAAPAQTESTTPITPANPRSEHRETVPEENLRAAKKAGEEMEKEVMRLAAEGVDEPTPSTPAPPAAPVGR